MDRRLPLLISFAATLAVAASSAIGAANPAGAPAALKPEPQFAYAEQLVTRLLSTSHYARRPIDDAMSQKVLEAYLEGLDGTRSYLLASDVAELTARHGTTLDDALVRNDVRPAYAIYAVYAQRVEERIAYATKLLDQPMDFTAKESFRFDRKDAAWPADAKAIDELWRQRVKNDLIGLMLTNKPEPEARELLRKRYANFLHRAHQVKSGDVFESFMNAYAQVYDPHTSYLGPRDSEEFAISMKLKYEGIGAALQVQDEYVLVARILPGGSAARAGTLKEQDRITAVGQSPDFQMVDVIGWRLDDVVRLIRGPKDTSVRLQVLPAGAAPGTPETFITLERGEIKLEDRAAKKEIVEVKRPGRAYKVGVVRIPTFYQDFEGRRSGASDYTSTTRDVRRLLGELKEAKVDGVVIDLRDNGGGSLQEAAELTGLFIDQGPVVQLRNSAGRVEVMEDPESGIAYDGPLTVMVNRFSASASEIFAGAIQDYGRGLVVGANTYGKGTIQSLVDLNQYVRQGANLCGQPECPPTDLGQLKITIGKFYRVTGSSTQHRGVVPDVQLPSAIDPGEYGESAQPSALPWDSIAGTEFASTQVARGLVSTLSKESERRAVNEGELKLFTKDVAEAHDANAKGTVSLVLAERIAERDRLEAQRLVRENQRRAARGEAPLAKLADAPPRAPGDEGPDPLLDEAAEILVDTVNLTGGASLAQLVRTANGKKPVPTKN
jgi:carboxyl-terminal processing protease